MDLADEDFDFLTNEDKDFVQTLRRRFHDDFAQREADGRAYPCFFGPIALARILRAVDGNVEKACEWFQAQSFRAGCGRSFA